MIESVLYFTGMPVSAVNLVLLQTDAAHLNLYVKSHEDNDVTQARLPA